MVHYEFRDEETGASLTIDIPMAEAPDLGSMRIHEGRLVRRVMTQCQAPIVEGNYFTNYQVRRGSKEAQGADAYEKNGRPIWKNKQRAREFAERKTAEGYAPMEFDK